MAGFLVELTAWVPMTIHLKHYRHGVGQSFLGLRGGMGVLGVIFNKYMIFELFTENSSLLLGL